MRTTQTGQPLSVRPFNALPTLIPSFDNGVFTGRPYKAELVLLRGAEGGARLHVWFTPDPRPHDHPWTHIDSKVIRGGYRALEYFADGHGGYTERSVTLRVGDPEHRLDRTTFHQIVEVEPGTVSLMSFGPVVGDGRQWGHLVREGDSWGFEEGKPSATFQEALWHLNPHLRPAGWGDPFAEMPVPDLVGLMDGVGF